MSTTIKQNQLFDGELPSMDFDPRVAIVAARWNHHITDALLKGARQVLEDNGCDVVVERVPGTVELTYAASRLNNTDEFDAIIVLGCVIKGDTPHFDYVCSSVTQGITDINTRGETPVIFGVLTTLDEQQALDRAGGRLGNKGAEAAITALHMIDFAYRYNDNDDSDF